MATGNCHNYLTPDTCNQKFYQADGQIKNANQNVFDRMDPKHRNMRKGDNPEILAALTRHVIASRHNHLNKELQQCKAGEASASCAFTPCIGCNERGEEKLDDTTEGIVAGTSDRNDTSKSIKNINHMYSNRARKTNQGIAQTQPGRAHMQVQQHFSNAGTGADADISVHQRGFDSPAYWEGGEDHGQRQQNIFNRYVRRNARTCNEFGNECGLMPKSTGTDDPDFQRGNRALGLPANFNEDQRNGAITGIYKTFSPNEAFANALRLQRVPSWAAANNYANITTHRSNPKSDKRSLGYED